MKAAGVVWTLRVLVGIGALLPVRAWACEPCREEWDFDKTVAHADVVVMAHKVADGPDANFGRQPGGPEWIDVDIIDVLKGSVEPSTLRVNSWDGMCPYGIVVDERSYVMLLVAPDLWQRRPYYDAVNDGCAQKAYAVSDDTVQFEGAILRLADFVDRLHPVDDE